MPKKEKLNRSETTKFLGKLLIQEKLSGFGKYWANEVSVDPFKAGKGKRVDFMQFEVPDQCYESSIEKGIFICYEIKSCKEDVFSGNGLNFLGEKNYIVTTMQCWKSLTEDDGMTKIYRYVSENFPESSNHFGIMVACPYNIKPEDDFQNPAPLPEDGDTHNWTLKTIIPCRIGGRNKSMNELLFCMLRSGR